MADTLTLTGGSFEKLQRMGLSPGEHVVLEVMGSVKSQTSGSFTLEIVDVKVLSMPKNFQEAAQRSYVALRIEQSVG